MESVIIYIVFLVIIFGAATAHTVILIRKVKKGSKQDGCR